MLSMFRRFAPPESFTTLNRTATAELTVKVAVPSEADEVLTVAPT